MAEFNVKIVKAERSDFSFLVPEPADITVPSNEYYSNPASSNIEPEPIEYYSSAPEIATVDKDTGNVDFLKAGKVTVKAVMPESDHYSKTEATYTITGKYKMSASFIEPTLIAQYGATIPKNGLNLTGIPNPPASATVAYELEGENADEIVSLNRSTGAVTAKKSGTVTVKATVSSKDYFDTEARYKLVISKATRTFNDAVTSGIQQVISDL